MDNSQSTESYVEMSPKHENYLPSKFGPLKSLIGLAAIGLQGNHALAPPMKPQSYSSGRRDRGPAIKANPIVPGRVKIGRNSPCPCGSGKKFKKCCGDKDPAKTGKSIPVTE